MHVYILWCLYLDQNMLSGDEIFARFGGGLFAYCLLSAKNDSNKRKRKNNYRLISVENGEND